MPVIVTAFLLQHRRWRMLFGKPAPDLPRALLHRIIAYRVQTDAMGHLDAGCAKLLDQLGRSEIDRIPLPERRRVKPGTELIREWAGKLERVMVLEQGFAWNGAVYERRQTSSSERRFAAEGVEGLLRDKTRPSRIGLTPAFAIATRSEPPEPKAAEGYHPHRGRRCSCRERPRFPRALERRREHPPHSRFE